MSQFYVHIYPLPLGPPSLHPAPLSHHRALSWAPCAMQQLPTSYLFYIWYLMRNFLCYIFSLMIWKTHMHIFWGIWKTSELTTATWFQSSSCICVGAKWYVSLMRRGWGRIHLHCSENQRTSMYTKEAVASQNFHGEKYCSDGVIA